MADEGFTFAPVDLRIASPATSALDRAQSLPFGTSLSLYNYNTHDGSPNGTLPMPIFARSSTDPSAIADAPFSLGQHFGLSGTVDRLYRDPTYDALYAGPLMTWRPKGNLDVILGAEAELAPRNGDQRHFQLAFAIGYRF